MMNLKRVKGFTLLEILIVLVILAVLAGLAVPAYSSAVEKSRVQEALTVLSAVRGAEQRYFAGNNTYTNNYALLDFTPNQAMAGNVPNFSYGDPVVAGGGTTYVVTATRDVGAARPAGVPAYTVTINQNGVVAREY